MMKKLFLSALLVSSFLVISCGNDSTNPTNDGSGTTPTASEYKANGIADKYAAYGFKFFSMDGNTYTISIQNGGITGLQQDTLKADLTKSDIYSINAEGDTVTDIITDKYRVYLIYNSEYEGSIIFPTDTTYYGSVNIVKSDGSKIEGIMYTDLPAGLKIPDGYKGTWEGTTSGGVKETVTIDDTFVKTSSSGNTSNIHNIPSSFFLYVDASKNCQVLGFHYSGTKMSLNDDGSLNFIINRSQTKINPSITDGKVAAYKDASHRSSDIQFTALTKVK